MRVADGVFDRRADCDVLFRDCAGMDLVRRPAPFAKASASSTYCARRIDADDAYAGARVAIGAEQAMDRQIGDLAGDVPQRHVDRADRARTSTTRLRLHRSSQMAPMSSGLRPMSSGLRRRTICCPSRSASEETEPRKAWPWTPSSVGMVTTPTCTMPPTSAGYRVGGTSQRCSTTVTSVIFIRPVCVAVTRSREPGGNGRDDRTQRSRGDS